MTTTIDLDRGAPAELAGVAALYILGVGGPEDESGIGDVSAFVWRFALVDSADGSPIALAFTAMPKLMQFTRAVNGRAPFTVPTEAFKVDAAALAAGAPVRLALDPTPDDFETLRAGRPLVLRVVKGLAGS